MTRRRTLALVALLVGGLSTAPALAEDVVVPTTGGGSVVVSPDLGERYVCAGTTQHGRFCVVVWYPW